MVNIGETCDVLLADVGWQKIDQVAAVHPILLQNQFLFSTGKISMRQAPHRRNERTVRRLLDFGYFMACSTATATATEAPTIGLLPIPMRPIISTWAGTEDEPANCASECMRPIVSVMP